MHSSSSGEATGPEALSTPRRRAEPDWQSVPTQFAASPHAAAAVPVGISKHDGRASAANDDGHGAEPRTPVRKLFLSKCFHCMNVCEEAPARSAGKLRGLVAQKPLTARLRS